MPSSRTNMTKPNSNWLTSNAANLVRDIVIGLISSVIITFLLSGGNPMLMYIRKNWLLLLILLASISLNVRIFFMWRLSTKDYNPYTTSSLPFSTLVDDVAKQIQDYNPSETDVSSTYLVHWVPTFSLSRGLNLASESILPSESHLYTKLLRYFQETHGKIICFDGPGIYRFLIESGLLYNNPKIIASYLEEVIQVLSDDRIEFRFLTWGMFPYTLLVVGDYYAIFDFTSLADLKESEGHKQSARRATLRLETTYSDEIRKIRRNIFDTFFQRAGESETNDLTSTISYLRKTAAHLRHSGRIMSPDEAESKFNVYLIENVETSNNEEV